MTSVFTARPMEAKSARELPDGEGWWFEPKWDGFRCLAFKAEGRVELVAKSGKSLNRFFPEVVARLKALKAETFGLDGELLAQEGQDWSFEVLQARLHPAQSRIDRLAAETPATFTLFDMLIDVDGADLRSEPLRKRQKKLAAFARKHGEARLQVTPGTHDPELARSWLDGGLLEGVIAKALDGPYLEGERAMVKVKRLRTADCVVGGFRYARDSQEVGSLLLGLYDDQGRLHHVGHTSGFASVDKSELTSRLEALRGGDGSPDGRRAARADGRPSARANGSRCVPSWSSRSPSTTSATSASGTEQVWSGFGRTRRRASAGWSSSTPSRQAAWARA